MLLLKEMKNEAVLLFRYLNETARGDSAYYLTVTHFSDAVAHGTNDPRGIYILACYTFIDGEAKGHHSPPLPLLDNEQWTESVFAAETICSISIHCFSSTAYK